MHKMHARDFFGYIWSEGFPRHLPDRYALLRVLQLLDAAQVMWQAVGGVASHNGDHNLWLQQRRLGLYGLLYHSRQIRRAAGHQSDQERPQHTDSRGPERTHLPFPIRPWVPGPSDRLVLLKEAGRERGRKVSSRERLGGRAPPTPLPQAAAE